MNFNITEISESYIEFEVFSDDYRTNYSDVAIAVERILNENTDQFEGWIVDEDMYRSGVGITADGKGMGHAAKFLASISRKWDGAPLNREAATEAFA